MPMIVVPGNHDIPLFDVLRRFLSPLTRFRRIVEEDLCPSYEDEEVFILGTNTAHSWTVADGKLSADAIERVRERLRRVPPEKLRILVCHHPLHISAADREGWVGGLDRIGERLDLVLTGHLHQSENEVVVLHESNGAKAAESNGAKAAASSALLVRAGTAISVRHRGETNSFNVIRVYPDHVEVELRSWDVAAGEFRAKGVRRFHRDQGTYRESQLS
jgi:hypothetical protein